MAGYQYPGNPMAPAIVQIFQQAQQAEARRKESEQREMQLQRSRDWQVQDRDFSAKNDAAQAKQQFEAKRFEAEQKAKQEEAEKRDKLTGVLQGQFAAKLQQSPDLAPSIQQHVDKLVKAGKINPIQLPGFGEQPVAPGLQGPPGMGIDPQQMQQFVTEAQAGAAMRGEKPDELPHDEASRRVLNRGIARGTPEYVPAYNAALAELEAEGRGRAKASAANFNVNTGRADVTKKTQGDQEDQLLAGRETLDMLDELKGLAVNPKTGKSDFSQFQGKLPRAGRWVLAELDDIDPSLVPEDSRPWFNRAQAYRATLDKYRSEEFKRLLGSAQTDTEIKNLVNAVISADMSSTQFEQAIDTLERRTKRVMATAEEVLSKGLRVGTPEYRKAFRDVEARTKAAPAIDPVVQQIRDMQSRGMSEAQIEAALANGDQ